MCDARPSRSGVSFGISSHVGTAPILPSLRRHVWGFLALPLLAVPTAAMASVTLNDDGRMVTASNIDLPCPSGAVRLEPSSDFEPFDVTVGSGSAFASQTSEVSTTHMTASGSISMVGYCGPYKSADSTFWMLFTVDDRVGFTMTGSYVASNGQALVTLRRGGEYLFVIGADGVGSDQLDTTGILEPGQYTLHARAFAHDGTAEFDFSLALLELPLVPTGGPVWTPTLALALALVGLIRAHRANSRSGRPVTGFG